MFFKKIVGIAACDPNGVIGKEGKLPWHYPEELKHFSETIELYPLVMGRKTYESLPKHYLEQRTVIIFSRKRFDDNKNVKFVTSLEDFFKLHDEFDILYVIGGAEIFNLFLDNNLIYEFVLTQLKQWYEGDTIFPLSKLKGWSKSSIRKNPLFEIIHYCNPLENTHEH